MAADLTSTGVVAKSRHFSIRFHSLLLKNDVLSIKLSSIFLSLNLRSLDYASWAVLLDLNSVSTTMASDQIQPLSTFQKLHYRNVWHKMPFTSFF